MQRLVRSISLFKPRRGRWDAGSYGFLREESTVVDELDERQPC